MRNRNRSNNKRRNKYSNKAGGSSGGKKRYNKSSRKRSNYSKKRGFKRTSIKEERYVANAKQNTNEDVYIKNVTFSDFNLHPKLQENIRNKGYVHPTKIQNKTIPHIIKKRDVLGLATTGSGKTAAFLLPMVSKAINHTNEKCLIVVPTRELANQIKNELKSFTIGTKIKDVMIIGGTRYGSQIRLLQQKPQFVIATPGRLIDLHEMNKIKLQSFNNIVLDEVDQMLDMGFIHDIEYIVSNLAEKKQSLFFSATMNSKAEQIANKLLKDPLKIEIDQQSASANVEQDVVHFKFKGEKINILHDLLINTKYEKVLVFSKTRRGADLVSDELRKRGHNSDAIHGEKSLGQRKRVMSKFREDSIDILVATDVAARGIDVPNISHIINYDEPSNYDEYIHRIGRAGRIGKKGYALTFVSKF